MKKTDYPVEPFEEQYNFMKSVDPVNEDDTYYESLSVRIRQRIESRTTHEHYRRTVWRISLAGVATAMLLLAIFLTPLRQKTSNEDPAMVENITSQITLHDDSARNGDDSVVLQPEPATGKALAGSEPTTLEPEDWEQLKEHISVEEIFQYLTQEHLVYF